MDMEKFTERSRGFMQAAQTVAIREENQRVVPEHLLKALMDDDQGFATNLITKSGGDARAVRQATDAAVAKLPKVSGGDGQVYVDPSLVRVLDEAQKLAQKAGDSFVPAERLLTALAIVNTNARDALQAGGVNARGDLGRNRFHRPTVRALGLSSSTIFVGTQALHLARLAAIALKNTFSLG